MSRGRTPRKVIQRQNVLRQAVEMVEPLEERRLMTTLTHSSEDANPTVFYYLDASKAVVRIQLTGDIVAEFTGARVRSTNNSVVIRDLIQANPPGSQGAQPADGADLFNIYVAQASPDAQIIITRQSTAQTRAITPYSGSVGTVRTIDNGELVDPDAGPTGSNNTITPDATGAVYIGARTVEINSNIDTEDAIPITVQRFNAPLGVRPNTRRIFAGIETAPGVSLDKILIAGTITGIVNIEGSINTFYAGNILTGSPGGVLLGERSDITNNFTVGGDLQNLIVSGSVGTTSANRFRAGTAMRIGGKFDYMHVSGAFGASVQVRSSPSAIAGPAVLQEQEYVLSPGETAGSTFVQGILSGAALVDNTTAGANNQFGATDGITQAISWTGQIQNGRNTDPIDNYSLPLLAGQSAVIELVPGVLGAGLNVGVFDPLGRFIASDISGVAGSTTNQSFQITAKVPGVYTLAVAFAGSAVFGGAVVTRGLADYTLNVSGIGNVSFGGADVTGTTRFREPGNGVAIRTGDLGGWVGRNWITGEVGVASAGIAGSPINLSRGNLRALTGTSVGLEQTNEFGASLQLTVPNGSVGYIHATAGDVAINAQAVDPTSAFGDPIASEAIGGDYQRVEASGDVDSALIANGGIGAIVAGGINSNEVSLGFIPIFSANNDQRGRDGNIDMIYVTGDVGATNQSGPGLYNGLSGNIKYFHVGGQIFRDRFFGNAFQTDERLSPGQSVTIKDDSGASAVITPTSLVTPTGVVDPITGLPGTLSTPGSLTITRYGVRGTGGSVVMNLDSTTSYTVTSVGTGGSFDITDSTTGSTGSPVFSNGTQVGFTSGDVDPGTTIPIDPITGQPIEPFGRTPSVPNEVRFTGGVPINVFNVTGNNVTALYNFTSGEVVGGDFTSLGSVIAQSIGIIHSTGNAEVAVPTSNLGAGIPFDGFAQGISVSGNVISVIAREGIGNVSIGGVVGVVNPNADKRNTAGVFEGIVGRVQAGTMLNVDIGEGVAFGGSGTNFGSGLFATNQIVTLSGENADIRGPVLANTSIGTITLTNGSIVNAIIGIVTDFSQATFTQYSSFTLPEPGTGFSLNAININGDGGILGSTIYAGRFGQINVRGFGILATEVYSTASGGTNGTVSAAGLGIRYSYFSVGSSLNTMEATGDGRVLSIDQYNARVQQTGGLRRRRYDAYTGRVLSATNDLNRMFGTSRTTPRISGATNAGVIQDTQVIGNGNLNNLTAYAIGTANTNTSLGSSAFPMRVIMANGVGTITTKSGINGLQMRTGSLDAMNVGTNLQRSDIGVAGQIGSINVGKTIRGTTAILAQGGNGVIDSIVVRGGLYGTVFANRSIGTIAAGVLQADIATSGPIAEVLVDGSVLAGANVRAGRTIGRVVIGGDFEDGAVFDATNYGSFIVGGENAGTAKRH